MSDVILAGSPEESFGGIIEVLEKHHEVFSRIETEIIDPQFPLKNLIGSPAVIISRFHEGDLASVKAMQTLSLEYPCLQMIFVTEKELSSAILTLLFNNGAFGILQEPLEEARAWQLIKQAIKRSKWNLDEMTINKELKQQNKGLRESMGQAEAKLAKYNELTEKLERFAHFILADKYFDRSKVKTLIVSNSDYQRQLVKDELLAVGFSVKSTHSSKEAISIIKSFKPDIVVSDLEMEEMNGIELANIVKGEKGFPSLHFVIITANSEKVDYVLSPKTKVDDCIVKPSNTSKHYAMVVRIALGIIRK